VNYYIMASSRSDHWGNLFPQSRLADRRNSHICCGRRKGFVDGSHKILPNAFNSRAKKQTFQMLKRWTRPWSFSIWAALYIQPHLLNKQVAPRVDSWIMNNPWGNVSLSTDGYSSLAITEIQLEGSKVNLCCGSNFILI